MEIVYSNIVKRWDGAMVNIRYEPVTSIRMALRFNVPEDFEVLMNGHHKPKEPSDYYLQPIKITYEEV